ncbi:hypothetical protein ACFXAZ_12205 [Streptomyces sp. NPDC059477]|uniref:hypothetical protein n=1 Tax=Streptomyces sp. NPDC059477 TaxID=3346847 RepID=UPI0036AC1519
MPEQENATNIRTGETTVTQVPTADEAYAAALLRERDGYARQGRPDRVAAVDAELERLGVPAPDGRETAAESRLRRTARTK